MPYKKTWFHKMGIPGAKELTRPGVQGIIALTGWSRRVRKIDQRLSVDFQHGPEPGTSSSNYPLTMKTFVKRPMHPFDDR